MHRSVGVWLDALARWLAVATLGAVPSCAGTSAEAPLRVPLGIPRDAATQLLRKHEFCHPERPPRQVEIYPRCDRPGAEQGDAWVEAGFARDALISLARWERYGDEHIARARWDQLVTAHGTDGGASEQAKQAYRAQLQLPAGVRSWVAFARGDRLIAVFLLAPENPRDASLLEHIVRTSRDTGAH